MPPRPRTLLEVFTREATTWRANYVRTRDENLRKLKVEPPAATASSAAVLLKIRDHCAALDAAGDHDALRVIEHIAARAVMGGGQYGPLRLAEDKRDWRKEAREEAVDGLFYMACRALSKP
jgi:hypothetical protein